MKDEIKTRLAQIRAGKIPQGYKKTKLSIIPQEWEVMSLKSRFDRLTRKNSEGNTNVMTISAQYGLINQEEFFKKEIASEDKSNYYLMYCGEFAFNKSYSNGYPFGAIKRLSLYDKGVVSPLYICFSANKDNPCPEFYQHYFEGGKLNSEIHAIAQEGARNHGLLNISVEDFFYAHIIVPHIEEQKKIADILSAQDKIIELCERKIEQLKRMKKYYLQNMFPKDGEEYPEIRFKGFTDPWEQRKVFEIANRFDNLRIPVAANLRIPGTTPYYGANGIQDYVEGFTHEGEYVLVAEDGANDLKNYPVKCVNGRIWVNNHAHVLQSKPEMADNKFLAYSISQADIEALLVGGGRAKLNAEVMMEMDLCLPSVKEQVAIGSYLTQLDSLITLHQRKCEEEKKKKKALQQLLLTGLVRV